MVYTLQAFKSSKSHLREVSTSLATPTQVNQLAHGLIIYTVPMLWWGIGYNSLQTIFYQGCIIAPKPFSILLVTWIRDTDLTLHFMFALISTTHWWERIPATHNVFLHTHRRQQISFHQNIVRHWLWLLLFSSSIRINYFFWNFHLNLSNQELHSDVNGIGIVYYCSVHQDTAKKHCFAGYPGRCTFHVSPSLTFNL